MSTVEPEEYSFAESLTAKLAAAPEVAGTPPVELEPDEEPAEEEQAPEETDQPEESAEEEPTEDRLRDDQGRYLPKFKDPDIQGFLAKYDGDLEKALRAAVESQSLIGRQGSELGELRRMVEEVRAAQQQPRQPERQYDPDQLQTWFDDNPHQIPSVALQAHQAGDTGLRDAAIAAWEELDRAGARQFERAVLKEEIQAQYVAPLVQQQQAQEMERVKQEFASAHPDFEALAPAMTELAQGSPRVLGLLQSQDPATVYEVLDYLYVKAEKHVRDRDGDTLALARQQAEVERQENARQAKTSARVASSASTKDIKPKNAGEQFLDAFREHVKHRPTDIRAGLTHEEW